MCFKPRRATSRPRDIHCRGKHHAPVPPALGRSRQGRAPRLRSRSGAPAQPGRAAPRASAAGSPQPGTGRCPAHGARPCRRLPAALYPRPLECPPFPRPGSARPPALPRALSGPAAALRTHRPRTVHGSATSNPSGGKHPPLPRGTSRLWAL